MAISIKHPFTSLKGDGLDATQVQPSNWNAAHLTSMATGNLLGRLTAGAGVFEEIPLSAYMAALLASADAAALAASIGLFETGDVKYTFKNAAATGWIMVTAAGSIGDATSGATIRANADTSALYQLIYNNCGNTLAPVAGGRGASAIADFNAHKALTIPQLVGRSPIAAGAPAGVTTLRVLGAVYGEEAHTMQASEMPQHRHVGVIADPGHTHNVNASAPWNGAATSGGGAFQSIANTGGGIANFGVAATAFTGVQFQDGSGTPNVTGFAGSGGAMNVIHPVIALTAMVKL